MGDLRDDLAAAVKDFRRVWPEPHPLSANLALAVRAVAELDALAGREAAAVAAVARAHTLADDLVQRVDRVRDHWAEATPEVRDRDLWTPMHESADRLRDALRALDGAGDEPRPALRWCPTCQPPLAP